MEAFFRRRVDFMYERETDKRDYYLTERVMENGGYIFFTFIDQMWRCLIELGVNVKLSRLIFRLYKRVIAQAKLEGKR